MVRELQYSVCFFCAADLKGLGFIFISIFPWNCALLYHSTDRAQSLEEKTSSQVSMKFTFSLEMLSYEHIWKMLNCMNNMKNYGKVS